METSNSVITSARHETVEDIINAGEAEHRSAKQEKPMKRIELSLDTNERQQRYVTAQEAKGGGMGLVFADAFIRGMRDIGYKNPAWALSEMTDNSIQAGATVVEIRLGFDPGNKSMAKPDMLAVIDNGAGMIPKMISYAVRWGGTDRENDRHGFGRYGYGLPSSAVSMARQYTVYSKTTHDDHWYAVTVNLKELAQAAGDNVATDKLLEPRVANLPEWLVEYERRDQKQIDLSRVKSGMVVVLEDIDRLRSLSGWITMKTLPTKLLQHFGVIYRHWLAERRIFVDGVATQIVDPLFLIPDGRYYDETPVMAKSVYEHAFEAESTSGEKGFVRIRASLLPPNFQLADPASYRRKGAKNNSRFTVMKNYHGLHICREGREIDCITAPWTRLQTYDRNVKIEVDFDPTLDEHFGLTTSKQQIVIDDQMWEKLKQSGKESGGLHSLVSDMRAEFKEMQLKLDAQAEQAGRPDELRPSERAMEEAERFRIRRPTPTPEKVTESKKNLEEEVDKIAKAKGEPKEKVAEEVQAQAEKRRWEVVFEAIEEGPFYIPKRLGPQKRIVINTAHPFYSQVYDQASMVKSALEVLLFVLADGEIDAQDDREDFYRSERQNWSGLLRHALGKLVDTEEIANRKLASQESEEETINT